MQDGDFEPEETRLFGRLLPAVDVVVNVGANIGYYCCIALSQGKQVIAFEPIHANVQCLLRNLKANAWETRAEVYPMALSDRHGVVEIYGNGTGASLVPGWAGTPREFVTLVPATTLDSVIGNRLAGMRMLVLVDIEGAEASMLAGAHSILDRTPKPVWLVEITISTHQPTGVVVNPTFLSTFNLFLDRGYEAWTADARCRLVGREEIERIARSGNDTVNTHNFLFIETDTKSRLLG